MVTALHLSQLFTKEGIMKIEHIVLLSLASMLLFGLLSLKVLSKEKWESSHRNEHWFQGLFLTIGSFSILLFTLLLVAFYDSNRSNSRQSECRSKNLPALVNGNYTEQEISDILVVTCK